MAIRGSCLLKDTPFKEMLFEAVEYIATKRVANDQPATIGDVYKELRSKGIEVDLPTIGEVYVNVLPIDDSNFSSETEVDEYTVRAYRDALDLLVELNTLVGERQIKDEKPERAIVNFLMRALYDELVDDQRTISDMKKLQDALWKALQRYLPKTEQKKQDKKTMEELIANSLGLEQIGIRDVRGHLNSIEDLFNSWRQELLQATSDIKEMANQDVVDRWMEYTKNLQNATYKLLFRRSDALQIRNEALIRAGFGKTTADGKTILDWDKMAAYTGDMAAIRANAEKAFLDAGYSQEVTERLKDTLEQEFQEIYASIVEKQLANVGRYATRGTKQVFSDADYYEFLGGRTEKQWIQDQNVENLEELHRKVNDALTRTTYQPFVKREIERRISEFFERNYARVASVEAQRIIDDVLGEQTALEWIIENGIQNQDELTEALNEALGDRNISPQNDIAIRDEFNRILDINNRAEKELAAREKQTVRVYRPKKSDMKRLVELYRLGIFEKRHESLLFKLLGVDEIQREDLADLQQITRAISELSMMIARPIDKGGYGMMNDVFASVEFQTMQRMVDSIIERNINNKKWYLRLLSFISNYLNTMLTSLLGLPPTLVQNAFSGSKSVLTASRIGKGRGMDWGKRSKQAFKLWSAMFKDVIVTGQPYGEEIGSFATQELFLNTLRYKWKGATIEEKAKSLLLAATIHLRVGLLAFDSAHKVAMANKVFYNIVFETLQKQYNSDPIEVAKYMNEWLYGQSFEDAKKLARQIIEKRNAALPEKYRTKITDAYVMRLANDIVKVNISNLSKIKPEVMEGIIKGAYHVAGLGLGHEPNQYFSRSIKMLRHHITRQERGAIARKDWGDLAMLRLSKIVLNNFIIQFAAGATNWLWLEAKEGLGLGLLRLIPGVQRAKWNKQIDFSEEKNIKDEIIMREAARNDLVRAVIGVAYTGLFWLMGALLIGGDDDEPEEIKKQIDAIKAKKDKTERDHEKLIELEENYSIYTKIRQNRSHDRWYRVMAPDLFLIRYFQDNSETKSFGEGLMRYVKRTYMAPESFTLRGKIEMAMKYYSNGDNDAANGVLASIVGDKLSVPLWRNYKEYARIISNPFRDEPKPMQPYYPPTNWKEGLFGGGFFEDIGLFEGGVGITVVPGIGPKAYGKFSEKGYKTLKDMEEYGTGWWRMKDKDGKYILDLREQVMAEKFWEKYMEGK